MFTFATTPVMFLALLTFFTWCSVWSIYDLTRRQNTRQRLSNLVHLGMAVVMLLMVAGPTWMALTSVIPIWGLTTAFAAATLWFVWLAIDVARASGRSGLLHHLGHAAMFAAMTWHLAAMAVMAGGMAHGGASGHDDGMGSDIGHGMGSGDLDMTMWWFAVIGLLPMTYLLMAAIRALWLAAKPVRAASPEAPTDCGCADESAISAAASSHTCGEPRPAGSTRFRLAALSDFAMNGGMFWMSAGLMVPLLGFFAYLAV